MSTTETVRAWATTNAGNAAVDAAIASSDTQSPDTLDNNIRSIMVAVRKQMDDICGKLVAGGTANALTVTTGQVLESGQLVDGLALAIEAASDNTSATVTFAPDGLTGANIKRADGSALAVGSIKSGMRLLLQYDAGASEWRCANIAPATSATGAAIASFSVNKNAVNQAVASAAVTIVTWSTEASDVGAHFASNAWTPPAGAAFMNVLVAFGSVTVGLDLAVNIYKDGVLLAQAVTTCENAIASSLALQYIDQASGSNAYDVRVASSDANYNVLGAVTNTFFQGTML